jgi:hypothetical protein
VLERQCEFAEVPDAGERVRRVDTGVRRSGLDDEVALLAATLKKQR